MMEESKDYEVNEEVGKFSTYDKYAESELFKATKEKYSKEANISDYLLEIALYNFWRDQHLYTLNSSGRKKFLAEEKKREEKITKLAKNTDKHSELTNIDVLSPEAHEKKYGKLEVEGIVPEVEEKPEEIDGSETN